MNNNNNNNNNLQSTKNLFDNMNNEINMKTAVWGHPTWFFLHSMAMAYPKKINENNPEHIRLKNSMYSFLSSLGDVLPCSICGVSYSNYIKTPKLSIWQYLNSREDLCYFIYLIHNRVNEKLGVPLCDRPSFEEVIKYYYKYRARGDRPCSATTDAERIDSLLTGCNDNDIKKKHFKNYKCVVNVIDKNEDNSENVKNDKIENFTNVKENFNKDNSCNIFLLIISILFFIIILVLVFLLLKKNKLNNFFK